MLSPPFNPPTCDGLWEGYFFTGVFIARLMDQPRLTLGRPMVGSESQTPMISRLSEKETK